MSPDNDQQRMTTPSETFEVGLTSHDDTESYKKSGAVPMVRDDHPVSDDVVYALHPNSLEWMDAAFLQAFLRASLLRSTLVGDDFLVQAEVARMWIKTEAALSSDPSHRMVEVAFYDVFAGYQLFEHIESFAKTCLDLSWDCFYNDDNWASLTARAIVIGSRSKALEQWEGMLKGAVLDTLIDATTNALQEHLRYSGTLNSVSLRRDDQHDSVQWKIQTGESTYVLPSLSLKHVYDALCRGEDVPWAVLKMLLSAANTSGWTLQAS
jgi:hypothetical protein